MHVIKWIAISVLLAGCVSAQGVGEFKTYNFDAAGLTMPEEPYVTHLNEDGSLLLYSVPLKPFGRLPSKQDFSEKSFVDLAYDFKRKALREKDDARGPAVWRFKKDGKYEVTIKLPMYNEYKIYGVWDIDGIYLTVKSYYNWKPEYYTLSTWNGILALRQVWVGEETPEGVIVGKVMVLAEPKADAEL